MKSLSKNEEVYEEACEVIQVRGKLVICRVEEKKRSYTTAEPTSTTDVYSIEILDDNGAPPVKPPLGLGSELNPGD